METPLIVWCDFLERHFPSMTDRSIALYIAKMLNEHDQGTSFYINVGENVTTFGIYFQVSKMVCTCWSDVNNRHRLPLVSGGHGKAIA